MIPKTLKKKIYDIIIERGFDINMFDAEQKTNDDGTEYLLISYKDSPMKYIVTSIKSSRDGYMVLFGKNDGTDSVTGEDLKIDGINKSQLVSRLLQWLDELGSYIEESETPDVWKIHSNRHKVEDSIGNIDYSDSDEYSESEKAQIRIALQDFREKVINKVELDEDQIKGIDERLDYLSKAIDRLSKTDWKGIAISTIINIGTAIVLDPIKRDAIMHFFTEAFKIVIPLPH